MTTLSAIYGFSGCFDWLKLTTSFLTYNVNKFDVSYGDLDSRSINWVNGLIHLLGIKENFSQFELGVGIVGFKAKLEIIPKKIQLLLCGPKNLNNEFTTCINVTGQGCCYLYENGLWFDFLNYILPIKDKFSRLDCAIDEKRLTSKDSIFPFSEILSSVKNRLYRSNRWLKAPLVNGDFDDRSEDGYNGCTITFGQHSNVLLRIYKKNVEQGVDYYWTRFELEITDDKIINEFIQLYLDSYRLKNFCNFFVPIAGFLRDSITFYNDGKDSHLDRHDINPHWIKFLDGVAANHIYASAKSKENFDIKTKAFLNSYRKFLAQYYAIYGQMDFFDFLGYNSCCAMRDFKAQDIILINKKRVELSLNPLSLEEIHNLADTEIQSYKNVNSIDEKLNKNEYGKGLKISITDSVNSNEK